MELTFKEPKRYQTLEEKGFKFSESYSESKHPDREVFKRIAKNLPVKEFKKLTQEEILALQCVGTQRVMRMTDDEHKAFHDTPIDPSCVIPKEEWVIPEWSIDNISHAESLRHAQKNTQYQSDLPGASEERKQSARDAFMYSPGADMTKEDPQRITGISPITSAAPLLIPVSTKPAITRAPVIGRLADWIYSRMSGVWTEKEFEEWKKQNH